MDGFSQALGTVVNVFLFASLLAFVVERLVELFVKPLALRVTTINISCYSGLVIGLLVSIAFNVDLFTPVASAIGLEPLVSWAGLVLTGLLVGGGSNLLHDVWPGKVA